ncbi:MAG: hypothetical protein TRG1_783 [Flavobacteriaceae bacterium FS1-H7996/R]|nr:MAG: hypothetical protein TRG1_783 [Flavobacteriaceae bacterium FS1-H7996/R]
MNFAGKRKSLNDFNNNSYINNHAKILLLKRSKKNFKIDL